MKLSHIALMCVLLAAEAQLCFAQQQSTATSASSAQQQSPTAPPAAVVAPIPLYPDTPQGLEDLIREMLSLQKKGDTKALASYVDSLVLPNARGWFHDRFGQAVGSQIADSYDRLSVNLSRSFSDTLSQLNAKHFGHLSAKLFNDSCTGDPTEDEYTILASRTREQPLYDVRLTSRFNRAVMSFFVYERGAFRYIGNLRLQTNRIVKLDMKAPGPKPKVTKTVVPVYPTDAKLRHIQGKVLLHAIIAPDGNICGLELKEGNLLLAGSALSAVRQWRYSPYIVDGKPVAVDTTITVVFNWGSGK